MRDVLREIGKWYDEGETFGLATVVNTFRRPTARRGPRWRCRATVSRGSVFGGCVRGAV